MPTNAKQIGGGHFGGHLGHLHLTKLVFIIGRKIDNSIGYMIFGRNRVTKDFNSYCIHKCKQIGCNHFGGHRQVFSIGLDKQIFERKIVNIFLPVSFNICFGSSKEPSH